jgi:anti-sigma factor RsiW
MMNCDRAHELLDALLDGRLEETQSADVRAHVDGCAKCSGTLENLTMIRTSLRDPRLRFSAPDALRQKVEAMAAPRPKRMPFSWLPVAAAVVISAFTTYALMRPTTPAYEVALVDSAVSNHLRSMMAASHLLDLESSDGKSIKPWFQQKLKFAPPVVDLADRQYAMLGARLDVVGDDPAAAVVYARDNHTINLFCWLNDKGEEGPAGTRLVSRGNCNVVYWKSREMTWCAVSDLNGAELTKFAQLLLERAD